MNLLHIDSSILGEQSVSRRLTSELVEALRLATPDPVRVGYRDLAAAPVPSFDGELMAARSTPAAERTPRQAKLARDADAVLAEFVAADTLVIGAPMYNFAVPAQLKAWVDLISIAGVTFRYGAQGPEGLMGGKRAIIVATAGGQHAGRPSGVAHTDYLVRLLGFLGIDDVRVLTAEGLAMGPQVREPAIAAAQAGIADVIAA
jgi:FMN-dependent NADH-azoreductase